jgi:GNAT superfamily N-acetyltransferase
MTSEIRIRKAIPSDADGVLDCVQVAYAHWVELIGQEPGPLHDDYAELIANDEVHVAESSGQVVGVLVLRLANEGFLLDNVAVDPGSWSTGLGRSLLMLAEQEARAAGFDSIYLYTHEKMHSNIALYRRIGYVEYARRTELGLNRVYMRKTFEGV